VTLGANLAITSADFESIFKRFAQRRKSSFRTVQIIYLAIVDAIGGRKALQQSDPNFGTNRHQNKHRRLAL
jgi:hypothetical protein